jgi:hypothetical protein
MIEDSPFVPKPDVTFPEGYGASWAGIRRRSVFTNAKEVEERDQHHVGDGGMVLCEIVFCSDCDDGGNWDGELGLGGKILIVKSFQNSCNGRSSECWVGEARRGSGCPSKTYFCATLRSATAME